MSLRAGKRNIRGSCTGLLIGFDKHWNVILKDAEERYRWREDLPLTETNSMCLGDACLDSNLPEESNDNDMANDPKPTSVPVRWVWKQRKFNQLLIKGDSVISIVLLQHPFAQRASSEPTPGQEENAEKC